MVITDRKFETCARRGYFLLLVKKTFVYSVTWPTPTSPSLFSSSVTQDSCKIKPSVYFLFLSTVPSVFTRIPFPSTDDDSTTYSTANFQQVNWTVGLPETFETRRITPVTYPPTLPRFPPDSHFGHTSVVIHLNPMFEFFTPPCTSLHSSHFWQTKQNEIYLCPLFSRTNK